MSETTRRSLAVITSTALPLVVVSTAIGVQTDRVRPENAAALVGAAAYLGAVFPALGEAPPPVGGGGHRPPGCA